MVRFIADNCKTKPKNEDGRDGPIRSANIRTEREPYLSAGYHASDTTDGPRIGGRDQMTESALHLNLPEVLTQARVA